MGEHVQCDNVLRRRMHAHYVLSVLWSVGWSVTFSGTLMLRKKLFNSMVSSIEI